MLDPLNFLRVRVIAFAPGGQEPKLPSTGDDHRTRRRVVSAIPVPFNPKSFEPKTFAWALPLPTAANKRLAKRPRAFSAAIRRSPGSPRPAGPIDPKDHGLSNPLIRAGAHLSDSFPCRASPARNRSAGRRADRPPSETSPAC